MNNTEEPRYIFAPRLSLARQQAGLSQAQAAKLLDFSRPTITEIEAGRRKVSMEELVSFSDIYDVSIDWLLGNSLGYTDVVKDRLRITVRNMTGIKQEDLNQVIALLTSLKTKDNE